MEIIKINPQGYCGGVKYALNIVLDALNDKNTKRPIYLLGNIIHNKHVVDDLTAKGIITVDDKTKTRLELLDLINDGTVIFSAHGVEPNVYLKAKQKGLNIIDATCPNVLIIHNKISEYLNKNYDIIYVGTKKHPECEGVLGISNKIHFINSIIDLDTLNITNSNIYVTNQTTLSVFDLDDLYKAIKTKYPTSTIDDKICNATTMRQLALTKQENIDLCIVVGDKSSSNTKKLKDVSLNIAHVNTTLCEDLASLDKSLLKNVKRVSITSGASTPSYIVDEIIDYLKTL